MMMLILHLTFLISIGFVFIPSYIESIPIDWQSLANVSSAGLEFLPINEQALLLSNTTANLIILCARLCHSNSLCRIFDFDSQSHRCRLFQGDITTMGSIVPSSSSQSRVGSIKLNSTQFANRGQSCSQCEGSRYLRCVNGTCQCQAHTYFDGSICQSKKLIGNDCNNSTECRIDLNYTCLPRMQCGLASMQTATIAAGNANGAGGSGLSALNYPTGIAVGIDNTLYVSDFANDRVMKYTEGSLIGSIVAGTGVSGSSLSQLNSPTGIHVDASSNIYVGDRNNYRIMLWRKNASVGIKVAGTGSPGSTLSSFGVISGLFVDIQGYIYVCDSSNHRVMKFTPNITNAVIVAGTGSAGSGNNQLNTPYGIYFDDINSYLYVADYNNQRIQRYRVGVSTNGTTVAGGNGQGGGNNQLDSPFSVCVSKITNAIYISDAGNNRIQRWNAGGTFGVTIAGNGASVSNFSTSLQGSMDIRLGINDTLLFVSETYHNRVWRFQLI